MAITCFFAASYVNADINRYYLGPVLMAWTWLAILAAVAIEALGSAAGEPPLAGRSPTGPAARRTPAGRPPDPRTSVIAVVIAVALLVPTVVAAPARYKAVDSSRQHDAQTWVDRAFKTMEPDAVIVSWWSYSTPLWYAQRVRASGRTSRSSTTGPGSTRTSAG